MKNAKVILLTSVATLFGGCGGDSDSGGDASVLLSKASIEGTWIGPCRAVGSGYGITRLTFDDSRFVYQSQAFSDSDCETLDNVIDGRGTYDLPGDVHDDEGTLLSQIDYTFLSYTWTFVATPAVSGDWAKLCEGSTDLGGVLNVLGTSCTSGSSTLNFKEEAFGTLWTEEGDLYATELSTNGDTVEKRSTAINKNNALEKAPEQQEPQQ